MRGPSSSLGESQEEEMVRFVPGTCAGGNSSNEKTGGTGRPPFRRSYFVESRTQER